MRIEVEKYYYLLIWIVLPILYWPNLPQPLELYKTLIFICLNFAYFGYMMANNLIDKDIFMNKIFYLSVLLLVVQIFSSMMGGRFVISFWGLPYRYYGILTIVGGIIFAINLANSKNIYIKYIKYGALFSSLIFIVQLTTNTVVITPNFVGGYLTMCLPFLQNIFLYILVLFAVLLTGSRGAIIACAVISILLLFTFLKNKKYIFIILLATIPIIYFVYPQKAISHFDNRINIWQKGIEAGFKRPLIGYGVENFEIAFGGVLKQNDFDLKNIRVDRAHNEILEIFVNSGIVGLILYLYTLYLVIIKVKSNKLIFITLVGYLIISNLNVMSINEYIFYYLIIGLSLKNKVL